MRISRNSLIIRWAYLLMVVLGDPIPRQTSLCALFWRTVLITPLWIAIFVTAVLFVGFLGYQAWLKPWEALWAVIIITGPALVLLAGVETHDYLTADTDSPSIIRGGFRAVKDKLCPIVKLD